MLINFPPLILTVAGQPISFLVESGATRSVIQSSAFPANKLKTSAPSRLICGFERFSRCVNSGKSKVVVCLEDRSLLKISLSFRSCILIQGCNNSGDHLPERSPDTLSV